VLHKHHLIIRVGAGLIQFVYGSHSRLAADLTLDKNLFPLPLSRAFSMMMMMIAFITIKSSLVPLIEGLCAQTYSRFEILVVCSNLLLFFFVKGKMC